MTEYVMGNKSNFNCLIKYILQRVLSLTFAMEMSIKQFSQDFRLVKSQ